MDFIPPRFVGKEEESLLLIGIVMVRNENGTADGVAKIMFFVRRFLGSRISAISPVLGIEELVAEILKGAAMERCAAGFGLDFDGAGTVAAILRAIVRSEDFEFRDSFGVGIDVQ